MPSVPMNQLPFGGRSPLFSLLMSDMALFFLICLRELRYMSRNIAPKMPIDIMMPTGDTERSYVTLPFMTLTSPSSASFERTMPAVSPTTTDMTAIISVSKKRMIPIFALPMPRIL